MIANASPPAIVRCLDSHGHEKNGYLTRRNARRHRMPGQRVYRCGDHFHTTSRPA